MSASNNLKIKLPTDFSAFHAEQVARQKMEEEKELEWNRRIQETLGKKNEEKKPAPARQQRAMSEEERRLWEQLEESEEDSNDGIEVEEVEGEEKFNPQEWKDLCKAHIAKRIAILESKSEEKLTQAEYDSLPRYDRMRIQHFDTYELDPEQDEVAIEFIAHRVNECANRETLQGYKWLRDNYTSAIGQDIYYLAMWYGSTELPEFERWALFGF